SRASPACSIRRWCPAIRSSSPSHRASAGRSAAIYRRAWASPPVPRRASPSTKCKSITCWAAKDRERPMAIEPDFTAFLRAYDEGRPQAVYTRRVADLDTPVSAYLKLAEGRDNAFLLESVQRGETRGRYSVVGLKPDLIWRCRDGKAEINRGARGAPDAFEPAEEAARPFESLRLLFRATQMALPPHLPPMAVGLFGYLG